MDLSEPSIVKYMDLDDVLPLPPMEEVEETDPNEDLAATFVEEVVGRYDWSTNWEYLKRAGIAEEKLRDWLTYYRIDGDRSKIFNHIEQLASKHRGARWK